MKINKVLIKDVYSTKEVKTNEVWVDEDGNELPIYRKVIYFGAYSKNGTTVDIADLRSLNIGTFFVKESKSFTLTNGLWMPLPRTHLSNANSQVDVRYNTSTKQLQLGIGANAEISSGCITIEYTKTTD